MTHFKKEKNGKPHCGNCGARLQAREKAAKSSRRPERSFPNFCVGCSREALKLKARRQGETE